MFTEISLYPDLNPHLYAGEVIVKAWWTVAERKRRHPCNRKIARKIATPFSKMFNLTILTMAATEPHGGLARFLEQY